MQVLILLALLVSATLAATMPGPVPPMRDATARVAADSLTGTVTDSAGRPLAGARVSVAELQHGTRTDSAGHFAFAGLPPGRYTIVVRHEGHAALARVVTVGGSEGALTLALGSAHVALPAVNVTAARAPTTIAGSPLPATEITEDELRKVQSVSIARAIERTPGVHAVTTGEQIGKPVIRGLTGSRVLVLDDGLRLEDYSWSDEDGPSIESRLAQRIEVIRGPASVLYGSDALGGVVNAIPADLPDAIGRAPIRRLGLELYGQSNNGEVGGALRLDGAKGRLGWRAFGTFRFAEDLRTPDGKLENTGYVSGNGEGEVGLRTARGTSRLRFAHYGGEFKLLEATPPPGGEEEEEGGPERKLADDRLQYTGNWIVGSQRLEVRGQFQRHNLIEASDDLVASGGPKDAEVFNLLLNTLSADVMMHHARGERLQGTIGVSGILQSNDSRGIIPIIPDASVTSAGLFAFEQLAATDRLRLLAGARLDARQVSSDANADLGLSDETRNYTSFSGDVGAVIQATSALSFAGNLGRAWRAPTLFEMFSNGPRLGEARFEIGDPTLDPEQSLNLDASVRWASRAIRAEVSAFRNDIDDFLFIRPTNQTQQGLPVYRYEQAKALLTGAEVGVEIEPIDVLTLRGRFDAVRGTDEDLDAPLPLIPPTSTSFEVELHGRAWGKIDRPRFGIETETAAKQKRLSAFDTATDGYTLLNLDLGGGIRVAARDVRIDIRVLNVADKSYTSFLSRYKAFALNPGRNVVVRLSTGF